MMIIKTRFYFKIKYNYNIIIFLLGILYLCKEKISSVKYNFDLLSHFFW